MAEDAGRDLTDCWINSKLMISKTLKWFVENFLSVNFNP